MTLKEAQQAMTDQHIKDIRSAIVYLETNGAKDLAASIWTMLDLMVQEEGPISTTQKHDMKQAARLAILHLHHVRERAMSSAVWDLCDWFIVKF